MAENFIPQSHRENNEKLISDGYVHLFEIKLRNGEYLYFKENNTVKWQGRTWTGIPMAFEGYASASGESLSRPTLSIANPEGSFSTFIRDGILLRSTITRYSVLYQDILNDNNIYQKKVWVAWNVPQLTRDMLQLELRNPMDGVNFDVPARMYLPPEFPSVTL
jgi:phage-related protein